MTIADCKPIIRDFKIPVATRSAQVKFLQEGYKDHHKAAGKEQVIFDTIPADATAYFPNYLGYLNYCWSTHCGVVVSPDLLWFTVMNEVAANIIKDPKTYATVFTRTPDQVQQLESPLGPLDPGFLASFIRQLKELVPVNIELFLPLFTTATVESTIAMATAFMEACSPYYTYRGGCGIPAVKVMGTPKDWQLLSSNVAKLAAILPKDSTLQRYFGRIDKVMADICANLPRCSTWEEESKAKEAVQAFWRTMFYYGDTCMSGTVVKNAIPDGWFMQLFSSHAAFAGDYPLHITRVQFTVQGDRTKYTYRAGVFSGTYDDPKNPVYLIPQFAHAVCIVAAS